MLVVTHKQVAIPTIKDYQPIVVGNGRVSYNDMYRDNIGVTYLTRMQIIVNLRRCIGHGRI